MMGWPIRRLGSQAGFQGSFIGHRLDDILQHLIRGVGVLSRPDFFRQFKMMPFSQYRAAHSIGKGHILAGVTVIRERKQPKGVIQKEAERLYLDGCFPHIGNPRELRKNEKNALSFVAAFIFR